MGLLRILLAISVVIGHFILAYPHSSLEQIFPYLRASGTVSGSIKVNCFFVIAGFYTQLMLQDKFRHVTHYVTPKFYAYRGLRLLPTYYIVVILNFVFAYLFTRVYHIDTNHMLNLKGSDTIGYWLAHLFVYVPGMFDAPVPFNYRTLLELADYLVGPQLWALSLEMVFIVIAPFILRNNIKLWAFTLFSFLLAFYYYKFGWVRCYVGASLIYFVLGCIGYKFYRRYLHHMTVNWKHRLLAYGMVTAIALMIMYFSAIIKVMGAFPAYFMFMGFSVVTIPFIAAFTKNIKYDRFIGELAYPIYLGHYVSFLTVMFFLGRPDFLLSIVLCFSFAILCYLFIDQPMRTYRENMILKKSEPQH